MGRVDLGASFGAGAPGTGCAPAQCSVEVEGGRLGLASRLCLCFRSTWTSRLSKSGAFYGHARDLVQSVCDFGGLSPARKSLLQRAAIQVNPPVHFFSTFLFVDYSRLVYIMIGFLKKEIGGMTGAWRPEVFEPRYEIYWMEGDGDLKPSLRKRSARQGP